MLQSALVPDQPQATYPLEPSEADMRAIGEAALGYLTQFITELPDAPAADLSDLEAVLEAVREPPPEQGLPFGQVLDVVSRGASKGFNTAGQGYVAYIPGGGLFAAAVADFLACGVNRFVNVWEAAPAFAQIEATVIRWLADQFDYPQQARGILTSGGSMANFSAIVAARRSLLPEDFRDGTMYMSDQTHASVAKSAVLAGFSEANIRMVPSGKDLHIDLDALTDMVNRDRGAGRKPFLLIASAGTTNTGAVDPIADMASVASSEGLWLHVDGAYGGFFQLTERGRAAFRGIEHADSITLDPHKGMFLPYGVGCLLVRDGEQLRRAHQVSADYLQDLAPETDIPNFSDYSPELSRDFRGLRVWLPIKLHGLGAFRAALDEKLDLARFLYEELLRTPGFELPWPPELSIVPFRYRPARGDFEEFNRGLLQRINDSRRVFLSSTLVGGRFTPRACILSHRTHRDRIEEAVEIIRRAASDLDR